MKGYVLLCYYAKVAWKSGAKKETIGDGKVATESWGSSELVNVVGIL